MDHNTQVKLAIYRHFAETGHAPTPADVAGKIDSGVDEVLASFATLRDLRVLALAEDESAIRMAPPFSGVPTQHVVESEGVSFFANCAWDALGIPAALKRPAVVRSRCEQSREVLELSVGEDGPPSSDWLFHCHVPAAQWWDDIVFT